MAPLNRLIQRDLITIWKFKNVCISQWKNSTLILCTLKQWFSNFGMYLNYLVNKGHSSGRLVKGQAGLCSFMKFPRWLSPTKVWGPPPKARGSALQPEGHVLLQPVFINQGLLHCSPIYSLGYSFSVSPSALQQQSWIAAAEITQPAKAKIFTSRLQKS